MNLFYIRDIEGNIGIMDKTESHHCVKVLRMKEDDQIQFIDGKGNFYLGRLRKIHPDATEVTIIEKQEDFENRPYYLHIAISPTKSIDRFEWFLEKATEIGVDRISPIICEHSERKKMRKDRSERVVLSAVKQSMKANLPVLDDLLNFRDLIAKTEIPGTRYIAHCDVGEKSELIKSLSVNDSVLVLIGPEGDFSQKEIELAKKSGFQAVSLGSSRLRTETAGVVVAQILADFHQLKA
jgi:16S rRNA (uracil1498-N3)-methyltransferase